MDSIIKLRNNLTGFFYRSTLKRILFKFNPEKVHNNFINLGNIIGKNRLTKNLTKSLYYYQNSMLEQKILGIKFENPVGLSAGFDKNAEIVDITHDLGFGFMEVGSITAIESPGNSGTRIKRIPDKKSLWVNLGLNNHGADKISSKLARKKLEIPLGISIAKSNCKETAQDKEGLADYIYSLKKFNSLNTGSFYVLNISCPNAYGGQPFSRPSAYTALLKEVFKLKIKKPIFVKLSPDLTRKNIDEILKISSKYKVAGFILSNLTKKGGGRGGYSGKMLEEKANNLLKYVYLKTKGKYILIGVGGVFSAQDAYKKIKLGANLVQLITGMIYQGPNLISEINNGLVELLKKDGYNNVSQAIGSDLK